MKGARKLVLWLAALLLAASAAAQAAPPGQSMGIVLVHGVLLDGSSWRGVYDVLTRRGFRVTVVQQPLTGFDEDVAATRRALDQFEGPVVLVGHSYGGAIVTVAGTDPKVKALVYVAGLQPDIGESAGEVAPPKPPPTSIWRRAKTALSSSTLPSSRTTSQPTCPRRRRISWRTRRCRWRLRPSM